MLDVVGDFKPDVVVLDIGMPLLDGYETARVLRARYGTEYPVLIAVSAYCRPTDVMLAKMAGFDQHFAKPVRPQLLAELLTKITPKTGA
jgi:CheY-like chemotaxis protein